MTNNEIIFENVRASFTPAQLAELVQATYTAEQIAARRANITITVDDGGADTAEDIFTAMLAADQFHTFAEWKRMGYSVKKGAKSAITCQLWKYTDKPGKAAREALTKNRCFQGYRWKQYAVCEEREPLEQIKATKKRPEEWRVVPLADSV